MYVNWNLVPECRTFPNVIKHCFTFSTGNVDCIVKFIADELARFGANFINAYKPRIGF